MNKPTIREVLETRYSHLPNAIQNAFYRCFVLNTTFEAKNNKNKTVYQILGIALNATNSQEGEIVVVYKDKTSSSVFVRELNEFLQRFTLIG